MHTLHKNIISAALTLALVGCGSSGSKSDQPQQTPAVYTFTLDATVTNKCGVEQPLTAFEFMLQDAEWEVISAYEPDEQGQVKFTTSEETINYTVITNKGDGTSLTSVDITSFTEVKSDSAAKFRLDDVSAADNSGCECITQDLEFSHLILDDTTSAQSSVGDLQWQSLSPTQTLFKDVEACRVAGGEWPVHSFMVQGPSGAKALAAYSGFIGDFSATEAEPWLLNASAMATEITTPADQYDTLATGQLLNERLHFVTSRVEDAEQVLIFDNHQYSPDSLYYGSATNSHKEDDNFFASLFFRSQHTRYSEQYEDIIELAPATEQPAIDEDGLTNIQADGEYDFSAVSGYPAIVITNRYRAVDPTTGITLPVVWTMIGQNQGTLPMTKPLPGYENVIKNGTWIESSQFVLYNSPLAADYQSYIAAFIKGQTHHTTGPLSNYHTHFVKLVIKTL